VAPALEQTDLACAYCDGAIMIATSPSPHEQGTKWKRTIIRTRATRREAV